MADQTGISWTDATWNPVRGCSRVSAGCQHCYAEVQAARIVRMGKGKPTAYDWLVKNVLRATGYTAPNGEPEMRLEARWTGVVRLVPEQLAWPLRKRKPLRIFVNSMSDLFHESLTNEQIAAVFGVMAACPQHTFQVLTKRAKRMREWFEWARGEFTMQQRGIAAAPHTFRAMLDAAYEELGKPHKPTLDVAWRAHEDDVWPLPNVWLGVSVENQEAADERIPELLRTPAAVRFLSCEPLLGPVDLAAASPNARSLIEDLDWIIAGCESGPGARPCSVEWLRSLRDQCAASRVAFFCKQAVEDSGMRPDDLCDECGERTRYHVAGPRDTLCSCACSVEGPEAADWSPDIGFGDGSSRKPGGVIELPYLDGVQHANFPKPTQEAPMRAAGQRPAPLAGEAHDETA